MCGLFGAWGWPELNTTAALKALQSRGPDDQGEWVDLSGLTLLHTRLAIQDLSPLGHQPMLASDLWLWSSTARFTTNSSSALSCKRTARFRSQSDTEVLLRFRHWGQALWPKLEGIFAVAFGSHNNRNSPWPGITLASNHCFGRGIPKACLCIRTQCLNG